MTSLISDNGNPIWRIFWRLVQNDMSTAVMWSKSKPDVEFQYGRHSGEFNGMSSQSHVSHCRVLSLGEFIVTIPEPHATLQGAVIWRNQCYDRATLQGVRIPSAILKIVLRHILFFWFLMQFRLWRAPAFISSPIHLLSKLENENSQTVHQSEAMHAGKEQMCWLVESLSKLHSPSWPANLHLTETSY